MVTKEVKRSVAISAMLAVVCAALAAFMMCGYVAMLLSGQANSVYRSVGLIIGIPLCTGATVAFMMRSIISAVRA